MEIRRWSLLLLFFFHKTQKFWLKDPWYACSKLFVLFLSSYSKRIDEGKENVHKVNLLEVVYFCKYGAKC